MLKIICLPLRSYSVLQQKNEFVNRQEAFLNDQSSYMYTQFCLFVEKQLYHDFKHHHRFTLQTLNTWLHKMNYLVKCGCPCWSKTMMMSPGSIPGSWSPSPWKTIFCPSLIPAVVKWSCDAGEKFCFMINCQCDYLLLLLSPLSMWTSKTFFCRRIFRPAHALQRSLWQILCPWPWQLWHTVDTCWTKPGSIWCIWTCMPVPWQVIHLCAAPFRLPRPAVKKEQSAHCVTKVKSISRLYIKLLEQEWNLKWVKSTKKPVNAKVHWCAHNQHIRNNLTYLHISHK